MNPKMITRLCRAVIALLLAALLLTVSVALVLAGGPGDLDPTFDDDGRVTADFDGGHDLGNGMVIQPDGKIIVAGQIPNNSTAGSDFGLARLNSDGSLDTSFDTDGFANADFGADDVAFAVARQSDGKIIVAGRVWVTGPGYNFGLARYNSNGSLDTGFDTDGKVDTDFYISSDSGNAVAIQSADGKIVVAGDIHNGTNYDFGLARYNSNGSLDTNFDTDGKVNTDFSSSYDYGKAVAIQADGKIVVAGYTNSSGNYDFGLARYNSNGSLDTSFDTDGRVTTDFAGASDQGFAVAIQTDGKIVVVGSVNGGADFGLARYNSNGSLDTSFDTDGKVTTDFSASNDQANAVVIQSDGKIVVVGQSGLSSATDFALARYNSDGSLDTFFGTGGKLLTDFVGQADYGKAVAIQSDGKIVAAGYRTDLNNSRDFALTRYKALTFDKSVDDVYPSPGQRITFTLIVRNGAPFSQTNGYISDNLPDGLTLAGPVVLDPSSAGTTGSPPALASGLTITNNELITITFPVTVSASLTNTTLITNTATFTSTEIITPRTASAGIEVRVDCAATIDSSTIYTTVQAAVNAASANDTIKVAGYCLGVVSQGAVSQTVYITKNLTLRGGYSDSWADPPDPVANPTVLDANGSGRVVVVTAAAVSVTLENLRLTGGTADSGGGVWNEGILTLDSVSVDGNTASAGDGNLNIGGSGGGGGGGIYNSGALTVTDSTISNNSATGGDGAGDHNGGGGGGGSGGGGGIYNNDGTLTVIRSTLSGNQASGGDGGTPAYHKDPNGGGGGGLGGTGGAGCAGNSGGCAGSNGAGGGGGGRGNTGDNSGGDGGWGSGGGGAGADDGGGSGNTGGGNGGNSNGAGSNGSGGGGGGGVGLGGAILSTDAGVVTIDNSTISGNQASGGAGGDGYRNGNGGDGGAGRGAGIFIAGSGTLEISNSTIAYNQTTGGSGGAMGSSGSTDGSDGSGQGGGIYRDGGTVTIQNTILDGNTATSDPNCRGTVTSQGYNLESGTDCGFAATGDQQSATADLDTLQDNGGPATGAGQATWTHALGSSSDALDHIPSSAGCGTTVTTDQRGTARPYPVAGNCDVGAYEYTQPAVGVPTLLSPMDSTVISDTTPTLTWNAVASAAGYNVKIGTDVYTVTAPTTISTTGVLADGTYTWTVRAYDASSNYGTYANTWSFTVDTIPPDVPVLVSPADSTVTNTTELTLTWGSVADVVGYLLDFDGSVIDVGNTTISTTGVLADGIYTWTVAAYDGAHTSAYTDVWSFTVDATSPDVPVLISPANGTVTNTTEFTLTWGTVAGAAGYLLDFDGSVIDVGNTTISTTGVLADGTYTWTVAVYDALNNTSAYTDTWSFTVDATPPDVPVLVSPANGTVTNTTEFTLTWAASAGAAGYLLDFDGSVIDVGNTIISTTGVLADGTYTWTVAAYDTPNNTSAYTDTWSFTVDTTPPGVPVLVSPANGTVTNTTEFTLTWEASAGAAGYLLDFDGSVIDVGNTTISATGVLADGTYTWTVAAYDGLNNTSTYAAEWDLEVDTAPPAPPALLAPSNGAITTAQALDLTWVASASSDVAGYLLDFNGTVMDVGNTTTYATGPLSNNTYTWTVAAYDGANNTSAYTDTWDFQVSSLAPFPPALLNPANGAITSTTVLTLEWATSVSSGVTGYLVDWNGTVVDVGNVTISTTGILADGTYTWTVAAYNGTHTSVYTDVWSFTVDTTPPDAPVLVSPANGTVTSTTEFTLTWAASAGATGYLIDFDGSISDVSNVTEYATGVLADGTYTWTVAAYDGLNNTSIYAAEWDLEVDTTPPAPPALLNPSNGTIITVQTLDLTWVASVSSDVAGYLIDFDGTVVDVGNTTTYATGPLSNNTYTWTVAAYDGVDNTSAYTDTWSFQVDSSVPLAPALLSPADGAITSTTALTLEWATSVSPGVTGYLVDWNGTVVDVGNVTISTTGILADGTYTWTVAAYNGTYTSVYTDVWSFTVDTTPPDVPVLVSPSNGTVTSTTEFTLTWAASTGAAGYMLDFDGSISDVSNVTEYATGVLADGTYTWTVAAYDGLNNTSIYAAEWDLEVDTVPPVPPALLNPSNGAITTAQTLDLTWVASASSDVAGYLLDFNGTIVDVGNTTTYATGPLSNNTYTWTVAAYDGANNTSAYTDTWSFEVSSLAPFPPALLNPADGAITSTTVLTLEWATSVSPGVTGYLVDWNGTVVDVGNVTISTTGILADGTYTWTVAAYDRTYTSVYTDVWAFTVDTSVPNTPPAAVDDSYNTTLDVVLTVPTPGVLFNDTDDDGDSLTAILDTVPVSGSLSLSADGSFVYTPTVGFSGIVSFTYHANDSTDDSNIATATITVTANRIFLPLVLKNTGS